MTYKKSFKILVNIYLEPERQGRSMIFKTFYVTSSTLKSYHKTQIDRKRLAPPILAISYVKISPIPPFYEHVSECSVLHWFQVDSTGNHAVVKLPLDTKLQWRSFSSSQPVKLNLNKKFDPKQKTIQAFNIDAQGVRK